MGSFKDDGEDKIMTLDHIALIISKEEHYRFYEKFGFVETKRIEWSYDTVMFMENEGIILEIFIDPNHPERLSGPAAKGLMHIAFAVDDLEMICEKFEVKEIRTDWFDRKFTFIKDFDGQPIEIKERGK